MALVEGKVYSIDCNKTYFLWQVLKFVHYSNTVSTVSFMDVNLLIVIKYCFFISIGCLNAIGHIEGDLPPLIHWPSLETP